MAAEAAGLEALRQGQQSQASQHFTEAGSRYDQALATLDEEVAADVSDLRPQLVASRERVRRVQHEQTSDQETRSRIERFVKDYDEIRFHDLNFPGHAGVSNGPRTRELVPAALTRLTGKKVGPGLASSLLGTLEAYRGPVERRKLDQVAVGCYELLLLWAEAEASTPQGGKLALQLLDVAAALARTNNLVPSQTFHLHRARYLAQAGDEQGAREERTRAAALPPRTALDHFLATLDAYQEGRFAGLRAGCEEILRQQPDHFWARVPAGPVSPESPALGSGEGRAARLPGPALRFSLAVCLAGLGAG